MEDKQNSESPLDTNIPRQLIRLLKAAKDLRTNGQEDKREGAKAPQTYPEPSLKRLRRKCDNNEKG